MTGDQHGLRHGEFLDILDARLTALGTDGVRSALLAHAQQLPARDRRTFLDIFTDPDPRSPATSAAERLLADIDTFTGRVRAGGFDEDDEEGWNHAYWGNEG